MRVPMSSVVGQLNFQTYQSKFGPIFIASNDLEICLLHFLETIESYEDKLEILRIRFPEANLQKVQSPIDQMVLDLFEGSKTDRQSFKLKIIGTEFQKTVLSKLKELDLRQPITYKDLASSLGRPLAYRAVASAVARNDIAFLVPCHMIVRSDRTAGKFRWGSGLKKQLIEFEDLR